jgi:uncharacterized protein (TIGR02001 family)
MNTFKKTTLALAVSALASGAIAQTAPAPAPATSPITANVTITNDYKYRGISQTNGQPAIQGGFDYAHESGFYIGNWNSTISWIGNQNAGVSAPVEMDFYGGIKKELIGAGFATDFGVLQYYYPVKGNLAVSPNTTELYLAQNFTFGPISGFVKVNYSLTTIFGVPNSSGSYYPDLTINYDTGIWGITANGHIGYQYFAGQPVTSGAATQTQKNINYTDWKLGLTKDFGGGLSLSASYISTNANRTFFVSGTNTNTPNNWAGRGSAVVALTKTF